MPSFLTSYHLCLGDILKKKIECTDKTSAVSPFFLVVNEQKKTLNSNVFYNIRGI